MDNFTWRKDTMNFEARKRLAVRIVATVLLLLFPLTMFITLAILIWQEKAYFGIVTRNLINGVRYGK